jgi:prepilin-type N-terminal cleavage/methylation domain-containing protein
LIQIVPKLPVQQPQHQRMPSFGGIAGHASTTRKSAVASGFSLVEVMVAMVIALLGILVMTQVFSLFEGQRRTTSGG